MTLHDLDQQENDVINALRTYCVLNLDCAEREVPFVEFIPFDNLLVEGEEDLDHQKHDFVQQIDVVLGLSDEREQTLEGLLPRLRVVLLDEQHEQQRVLVDAVLFSEDQLWFLQDQVEVGLVHLLLGRVWNSLIVLLEHLAYGVQDPELDHFVLTVCVQLQKLRQIGRVLLSKVLTELLSVPDLV